MFFCLLFLTASFFSSFCVRPSTVPEALSAETTNIPAASSTGNVSPVLVNGISSLSFFVSLCFLLHTETHHILGLLFFLSVPAVSVVSGTSGVLFCSPQRIHSCFQYPGKKPNLRLRSLHPRIWESVSDSFRPVFHIRPAHGASSTVMV